MATIDLKPEDMEAVQACLEGIDRSVPVTVEFAAAVLLMPNTVRTVTGRAPVAAQIQTEHAAGPGTSAASESADTPAHPRPPAAVALAEAASMVAEAPAAREASEISVSPAQEAAPSLKPPRKKPRLTSLEKHRVVAGDAAHNSAFRHHKSNVVHHHESLLGGPSGLRVISSPPRNERSLRLR